MTHRLRVAVEASPKRTFLIALDWPGWTRAGRTEQAAGEALIAAAPRYATVVARIGESLGGTFELEVVDRLEGDTSTEFGVPHAIGAADREPTDEMAATRLGALVEAAWDTFDAAVDVAPGALRKGPRGGGRDRSRIVEHVNGADEAYARTMGIVTRGLGVPEIRAAMLAAIRAPSDGSPLGGRKWPVRYAARRVAWHALDHAWEIEDRTDPS